jgi:hypothetical protein
VQQCRAIQATFARRRTALPTEAPLALTTAFSSDEGKRKKWQAFLRKNQLDAGAAELEQVAAALRGFLMPPVLAGVAGTTFEKFWPPGGPWTPPS